MSPLSNEPTVEEVLDALALIVVPSETQAGIVGVVEAFGKNTPRSLSGANFPCVVWLPGPVQPDWAGVESSDEEIELDLSRIYYGVLFVAPANTGAEGESFADAVPFIDRFWNFFLAHQQLGGISPVQVRLMSDTGIRNDIMFSGQIATGIRFELAVTSSKHVEYAEYE